MARLEIPQQLRDLYGSFHEKVMAAAKGIDAQYREQVINQLFGGR